MGLPFSQGRGRWGRMVEIRLKATGDAFREEPILVFFPDGLIEFSVTYNVTVY
jgi:hypothetical protein